MIDPEVAVAAARVVDVKCRLDAQRRAAGEQTVAPAAFVQFAFPFSSDGRKASTVEKVPSELVIGQSWNDSWDVLPTGHEADLLCDRLDKAAIDHSEGWAILVRVGTLPLWYAIEGKNRVRLYRALKRPILAETRVSPHPDARDLIIRRQEASGEGTGGGRRAVGISKAAIPQLLWPLPVPQVADLLLALGAVEGARLSDQEVRRLRSEAHKRTVLLECAG